MLPKEIYIKIESLGAFFNARNKAIVLGRVAMLSKTFYFFAS